MEVTLFVLLFIYLIKFLEPISVHLFTRQKVIQGLANFIALEYRCMPTILHPQIIIRHAISNRLVSKYFNFLNRPLSSAKVFLTQTHVFDNL